MKRTSAANIIASIYRWKTPKGASPIKVVILIAVVSCCATLIFQAGRHSIKVPPSLQQNLNALQLEIQLQQGQIDRLSRQNVQNINALGARLAELQAADRQAGKPLDVVSQGHSY